MSAIVMRIRAVFGSNANAAAKHSRVQSREELAAFDCRRILLSGRGISSLGVGLNGSQRKAPERR